MYVKSLMNKCSCLLSIVVREIVSARLCVQDCLCKIVCARLSVQDCPWDFPSKIVRGSCLWRRRRLGEAFFQEMSSRARGLASRLVECLGRAESACWVSGPGRVGLLSVWAGQSRLAQCLGRAELPHRTRVELFGLFNYRSKMRLCTVINVYDVVTYR